MPQSDLGYVEQIAEDKVCACKTPTACTEAEMFKRLLYNRKDCDYYPAVEATLELCDWAFLTCFTLELLCKVAARGFCLHKHSYLWDPNNWLDFVVVVTGIMSKIADSLNDPNLQEIAFFDILRLVRVFRPLRSSLRLLAYIICGHHNHNKSVAFDRNLKS